MRVGVRERLLVCEKAVCLGISLSPLDRSASFHQRSKSPEVVTQRSQVEGQIVTGQMPEDVDYRDRYAVWRG